MALSNMFGIIVFVAIAGAFGAITLVMARGERRAKETLRAFATERRYQLDEHPRRDRQATRYVLRDDPRGLQIVITRPLTRKSGSSTTTKGGSTTLSLPDPRFDGGLALYSDRAASGVASAASGILGVFDNALSRSVLSRVIGDEIGAHLGQLQAFEPEDGSAVTIMASVDPRTRFPNAALAEALAALPRPRRASGMGPMILIGTAGLKIKLGRDLMDPAQLAALIDTARRLQSRLG